MKKSYQFFTWIVLLILGLIAVLVTTQINSSGSVNRLVLGNQQATATFLVNNRLEEMVNFSFEVESKMVTEKPPYLFNNRPAITDSVHKLLLKADRLEKIMHEAGMSFSLEKVIRLVKQQALLSSVILSTGNNGQLMDSLKKKHFGDSIYLTSLAFQMDMEKTLEATLNENNQVAKKVSLLNKMLAITALVAILLLGTIIIRRQVMQFLLIKDLEQARKLALQSVKIKDQFLANMSHEIRTPLNALKGFSQLLSKTKLNEEQEQFSSIINSSSESLLHIVNDILDFSKMEAGAWAIKNKPFSLHALLKNLQLTYTTIASEKKLVFNFWLAADVEDRLSGDEERLKQVLINLISNAVKFTNEGSVSLIVSLSGTDKNTTAVNFVVADTGIGIPDDKQDLIFERFEQLDNSFMRQQGGTGLGLAISRRIIQLMGGHISVSSEPGKGSRFNFTVNFKQQQDTLQLIPTMDAEQAVTDPACKAVLLAEDNKVNQLLVQKMLAPFNIQPVIAENGHDVLQLLEQQHFDLVLMDVQMPLMDGITATRLIRKNLGKQIPVIGLTAYVQPVEIEKCYAAGMNEYIPKPINEQLFLTVLKKYIYLAAPAALTVLPPANTVTFNLDFLHKICNGNKQSMDMILDTMTAALPGEKELFEKALAQKDDEALRTITHHLKSTLSPLGADAAIAQSLAAVTRLLFACNDWPVLEQASLQFLSHLDNSIERIKNKKFDV